MSRESIIMVIKTTFPQYKIILKDTSEMKPNIEWRIKVNKKKSVQWWVKIMLMSRNCAWYDTLRKVSRRINAQSCIQMQTRK